MWDLLPTENEQLVVDSVRDYLGHDAPVSRLRPGAAPYNARQTLVQMAELGWIGAGLPESVGGAGLSLVEEMLTQRECGRHLVSPCVLATVLAAHVAMHAQDRDTLTEFISGKAVAALGTVLSTHNGRPDFTYVLDWNGTDPLLLWDDEGMGLYAPEAFLQPQKQNCLDESVTLHAGRLTGKAPLHWISSRQAPLAARSHVLLAAALIGVAECACDITVDYVKVRQQFGKPIGSFQAVKHRCADMAVRGRVGWYQTALACLKVQDAAQDAPLQVAAALLTAAQAAHENARGAIQLHGGIGYQSECDLHWFMKRAHVYDRLGGGIPMQAEQLARMPSPLR